LIALPPALRLLAGLKLRGAVRKQIRRLRRPRNVLFLIVGVTLTSSWLWVLAFPDRPRTVVLEAQELRTAIEIGCAVFGFLTVTSALSHRGLYLPPSEIELLLSAPVSRADLVRFRIVSGLGRTLFGGVVIGLMVGRYMPHRTYGCIGAFTATLILPVAGQGVSLLAGSAENRIAARLSKLPLRVVNLALVALVFFLGVALTTGARSGARLAELGLDTDLRGLLSHPVLVAVLLPFRPWANMMAAGDATSFLLWFAVCAGIWLVAFEFVARVPVDFRELSLATSADVAQRLRRGRRGPGKVAAGAAARRLPWIFGRGPFGAIAWRKALSIARKAKGAMFTGAMIVGALTIVSTMMIGSGQAGDDERSTLLAPAVLAMIGTIYLCAGLRLDFREDLDQMEIIKAWPLAGWKVFLATMLPESVLVTAFVWIGMALQVSFAGIWHPAILLIAVAQPIAVLMWTSIDNLVFLHSPIRYTPGQDGALNHTGRAMLSTLVRLLVFALASAGCFAAVGAAFLLRWATGFGDRTFAILSLALGLVILILEVAALVWAGGAAFRRFDVARDRG